MQLALLALLAAPPTAQQPVEILESVSIEQRLGAELPRELRLLDASGSPVELGDFLGELPLVLVLVYYECPSLCDLTLDGLVRALRPLPLDLGRDFQVLAVSIDPNEGPALARERRAHYAGKYGRAGAEAGLHFLVGAEPAIRDLAASVGFGYALDPATGEYAHGSVAIVLTPEGRVASYLYGVDFPSRDLRLALVDASGGTIGSPVDRVLLRCFRYDPTSGRYNLAILGSLRVLAVATLAGLVGYVAFGGRRRRMP